MVENRIELFILLLSVFMIGLFVGNFVRLYDDAKVMEKEECSQYSMSMISDVPVYCFNYYYKH